MRWISPLLILLAFAAHAQPLADVESHNKLALKLLAAAYKNGENTLLSPFNIYSNLGTIAIGSSGQTEKQLLELLNTDSPGRTISSIENSLRSATDHKVISISNSIWMNSSIKLNQNFSDRFTKEFKGEQFVVPSMNSVETIGKINKWVADKTDHKIEKAVDAADMANAVAALVNTILFKGTWTVPFDSKETKQDHFYQSNGDITDAMYMHRDGGVNSYTNEWLTCYELFFHDNLSFVIATGTEPTPIRDMIDAFEYNPSSISGLLTSGSHLKFYMPKFNFSYKTQLVEPLAKMGLTNLFSSQADLSKMFEAKGLYVDKIAHSTNIEVSEKGVEAAASTAVAFARSMPPTVKLNHPFVFFILAKPSNAIIFEGVLEIPSVKN